MVARESSSSWSITLSVIVQCHIILRTPSTVAPVRDVPATHSSREINSACHVALLYWRQTTSLLTQNGKTQRYSRVTSHPRRPRAFVPHAIARGALLKVLKLTLKLEYSKYTAVNMAIFVRTNNNTPAESHLVAERFASAALVTLLHQPGDG